MLEMQETQVKVLGWEDPLEKEMATHSRISWSGKSHRQRRAIVHEVTKSQPQLSSSGVTHEVKQIAL